MLEARYRQMGGRGAASPSMEPLMGADAKAQRALNVCALLARRHNISCKIFCSTGYVRPFCCVPLAFPLRPSDVPPLPHCCCKTFSLYHTWELKPMLHNKLGWYASLKIHLVCGSHFHHCTTSCSKCQFWIFQSFV